MSALTATDTDAAETRAALADHRAAVAAWLQSSPADRALRWRAVESAWRRCKSLRADLEASKQSAALMRADGKLRSIA